MRILWSDRFLYLGYTAPFESLTVFDPPSTTGEREGLWDRDVVEAFIGADAENARNYTEYEVAPTGERLDLKLDLPGKPLEWNSGFESAVHVDEENKIWTTGVSRWPQSATLPQTQEHAGGSTSIETTPHAAASSPGVRQPSAPPITRIASAG